MAEDEDAPAFVTALAEGAEAQAQAQPTLAPEWDAAPDPSVSVDAELDELQRRYRIMEGDRKSYAEEVQTVVRKQKAQIEKLKRENGQLKQELELQSRSVAQGDGGAVSTRITKLQDAIDAVTRSVESEKKRGEEVDLRTKTVREAILAERKDMGGNNAPAEQNQVPTLILSLTLTLTLTVTLTLTLALAIARDPNPNLPLPLPPAQAAAHAGDANPNPIPNPTPNRNPEQVRVTWPDLRASQSACDVQVGVRV